MLADDLTLANCGADEDEHWRIAFILAHNGDVIQSVNPDVRIKGQRSTPRGEWRIVGLPNKAALMWWSRNRCNSLVQAMDSVGSHKERNH